MKNTIKDNQSYGKAIGCHAPLVVILYSSKEPRRSRGGGIYNAVLSQAIGLQKNGVDVALLTSSAGCADDANALGIPVLHDAKFNSGVTPIFSPSILKHCRELNRRQPVAVIHNSGRSWLFGGLMFPSACHAQVLHREIVRPYRFFRHWIALSTAYRAELKQSMSGKMRKIAVAYNGLLEDPPSLQIREINKPLVVGVIGRPGGNDVKGLRVLIESARILKQQGAAIRFRIAGPEFDSFIAEVEQLGLADIISFDGWCGNLEKFFSQVDVFCLPSRKEAFGIVLIEAMAYGVPIVSSSTNGAKEVIVDGHSGRLIPIGDATALANALIDCMEQPEKTLALGKNGYHRALSHFTPGPTGEQLIEALRELGSEL